MLRAEAKVIKCVPCPGEDKKNFPVLFIPKALNNLGRIENGPEDIT